MSISPVVATSPGTIQGVTDRLGDLDRRLRAIEGVRTALGTGTVSGTVITPGSVSNLSVLSVNLGTITAGTVSGISVTGSTVTGGTIQTSSNPSAPRVVMDTNGLRGYGLGGAGPIFNIDNNTGIASFTGVATLDPNSFIPTTTLAGAIPGGNQLTNSSFEQGNDSTNGTDQWFEGWDTLDCTVAKETADLTKIRFGLNSAKLTALYSTDFWIARGASGHTHKSRVIGGRPYTASVYARGTAARNAVMFIEVYSATYQPLDLAGNVTTEYSSAHNYYGYNTRQNGQPTGNPVLTTFAGDALSTTEMKRHALTIPALPSNAAFVSVFFYVNAPTAGDQVWVDGFQLEEGDVLSAYSPKPDEILYSSLRAQFIGAGEIKANNIEAGAITAVKMGFKQGGKNLLKNSSFEFDPVLSDWGSSYSTPTITTTGSDTRNGNRAVYMSRGTTGPLDLYNVPTADVTAGVTYTASAYVKSQSTSAPFRVLIQWFNGGTFLSSSDTFQTTTVGTTWTRLNITGTAPASATKARVVCHTDTAAATIAYIYDDFQLEQGEYPTDWSQFIDPTVIDGSSLTAATIRTSITNPKVQLDGTDGLFVTDSSGTIVANFKAGAGGLDLTGSTADSPPEERKIRWMDPLAMTTPYASISSKQYETTPLGFAGYLRNLFLSTKARSGSGTLSATTTIDARNNAETVIGSVSAQVVGSTATASASAGSYGATLINSNGDTVFPTNTTVGVVQMGRLYTQRSNTRDLRFWYGDGSTGYVVETTTRSGEATIAHWNGPAGTWGAFAASSYAIFSDGNMKTDFKPLTGSLAKINALKPRKFKWKNPSGPSGRLGGLDDVGMIAQEVALAIPEAVTTTIIEDGSDPVRYGEYAIDPWKIVTTLVGAVQELTARVKTLEGA